MKAYSMNDESPKTFLQTLKCSECGAKISPEALQSGNSIICEYCGAINIRPSPSVRQQTTPRGGRRPWAATRHGPLRTPLVHTTRLLTEKGIIDAKTLRKYTKRNIDRRMRPVVALRRALRQMHDENKLDPNKILRAIDELITEKKLPPRVRNNFLRLFQ